MRASYNFSNRREQINNANVNKNKKKKGLIGPPERERSIDASKMSVKNTKINLQSDTEEVDE